MKSRSASPTAPVLESAPTVPPAAPATPSAPPTRVLHVINGEHYSGAERVQDLLAKYLPQRGYQVGFVCVKPGRFPEKRRYRQAPLFELPMRGAWDFRCGRRIAQLVRDENYALIHAHTPRSLAAAAQAARRADLPLVYHVHSPAGRDSTRTWQNRVNLAAERYLARGAARLIAVSPSVEQYMIDAGFPATRLACVPNGVPCVDIPSRSAAPSRWTLGMAALFRPRKGTEVLIDALSLVRRRGHDVRLRAIGPFESDEYEAMILARAAKRGVADAIDWVGFADDMAAELRKIDALVLPSLFGEGLPMVVLEAMAAGVPVLASHVEGVPLAVRDGVDGRLVEPGDADALAIAVEELVTGRVNYASLSASAQDRHAAEFSAELMAARVAQVYDQILGTWTAEPDQVAAVAL